ncbi:MAG: TIGR03761 family integrating conjugative element protein [Candidatus Thiodiazotropha lotti]|uniref:TIGR03761 family integrating conjugative element protein n=1 Tax=Candidatus Thiodiazotropha lotti TaxID=2792787 RepID=A0A9E4K208_9GAMM|nr:TIGR03761 family integrating conjugative element protein [Candidatus Thiodiazotropha lotti]MCW4202020.1 TIGR03761 family integrating conjugative element protein [Candidatus Thiodiazotropha lotti]
MADASKQDPQSPTTLQTIDADKLDKARVGRLQASSTLKLETLQSQLLFNGRREKEKKDRIIGLRGFGSLLTAVWHGAVKDCPWAWEKLLQVEETLKRQKALIEELTQTADQSLVSAPGLSHSEAHSIEPLIVEIRFSTPYSYIGASLLSEYDRLVRLAMQAQHVGRLADKEAFRLIHKGGRAVRGAFESAFGYKFSGLTTNDLLQGNAKAKETVAKRGQVSDAILRGLKRPEFTPKPVAAFSARYYSYRMPAAKTEENLPENHDRLDNRKAMTN